MPANMDAVAAPRANPRDEVARHYCRTLTVIDDQILGPIERTVNEPFQSLFATCEEHGILCHLNHYPTITYDPTNPQVQGQVKRAVKLALAADVTVLDWNLGQPGSHEHALRILDDLQKRSAIRVILIYTQETDFDQIGSDLTSAIPGLKQLVTVADTDNAVGPQEAPVVVQTEEDINAAPVLVEGALPDRTHNYHLDNRLFLFIRSKNELDGDKLIGEVFNVLTTTFTEHLQWAGLEMAIRARDLLPQVVSAMPMNANASVEMQVLYQNDGEVAMQVSDILLDELRYSLQGAPLTVVSDEYLFDRIKSRMVAMTKETVANVSGSKSRIEAISDEVYKDWAGKIRAGREATLAGTTPTPHYDGVITALTNLSEMWNTSELADIRSKMNEGGINGIREYFPFAGKDSTMGMAAYIEGTGDLSAILSNNMSWANARESVQLPLSKQPIQLGYVLKRNGRRGAKPAWLLCIAPSCDCYRPAGKTISFLAGVETKADHKSITGDTQTCIDGKQISWSSGNLVVQKNIQYDEPVANSGLKRTYKIDGAKYTFIGALRESFAMRIIQRTWSHQSRVGVDTAELMRACRGE